MADTKHINALTSVRFFAALFVVIFHIAPAWLKDIEWLDGPLRDFSKCGFSSVGFFYILSGFVLSYNYAKQKSFKFKKYYIARFARIYPVYFFALLVAAPSAVFYIIKTNGVESLPAGVLTVFMGNALLLTAWVPEWAFWNYPGWSLSAEAFFYLVFPFLLFLTNKLSIKSVFLLIPTLVAVEFFIQLWVDQNLTIAQIEVIYMNPLLRVLQFSLGIFLAKLFLNQKPGFSLSSAWVAFPVSLLLIIGLLSDNYPRHFLHTGLVDLLTLAIIYLMCQRQSWTTRILNQPLLILLGEASYALYILHVPIRDLFKGAISRISFLQLIPSPLIFFIYLFTVIILSVLTLRFIEHPSRVWIKKRIAS